MLRTIATSFLLVSIATLSGCGVPHDNNNRPDRFKPPPQQPPRPPDLPPQPPPRPIFRVACDGTGYYEYDCESCTWYFHPNGGGAPQPIQGNPPCTPDWVPDCNQAENSGSASRGDLGLVPDENGMVAPQIWFQNILPSASGLVNSETRFDLLIATEATWQLPFDVDNALFDAIGAQNIHAAEIQIVGDGNPAPILVVLQRIRLGDAITVLTRMGIYRVHTQVGADTYTAEISGDLKRIYLWKNDDLLQKLAL